jgi:hypothetical protein
VLLGIVLIAALLANASLAVLMRAQRVPFIFLVISTLYLFATLAIFFAFTFPANWEHLRWQWEVSHAVNAMITFVGFCSLTISTLLARE